MCCRGSFKGRNFNINTSVIHLNISFIIGAVYIQLSSTDIVPHEPVYGLSAKMLL